MTALSIRNDSGDRGLHVCIWHASNAFASDGDAPWLDESGAPSTERSRTHPLAPGRSLELDATRELALTVYPEGAGGVAALFAPLMRALARKVSHDDARSASAIAVAFTLASLHAQAALRVRVFASPTFQFSPLREFSLAPGNTMQLSTGENGISIRVG